MSHANGTFPLASTGHRPLFSSMRKFMILLLVAGMIVSGCRSRAPRYLTIANPASEQILSLTRLGSHPDKSTLKLRVTGKIDGAAKLILLQGKQPRETLSLAAGAVDTNWRGDWSGNELGVHYVPVSVKGGGLQITCEFSD